MAALESLAAPAGALALLAFGAVAWRDWPPPAVGGAPNYLTETAARGPIMRRLAIDGMVEASAQTPVVATVSGTIASLACRNGMHVEAGMVCARLDALSYRRTLENQRAKLAAVKNREARREKLPARQQARLAQEATNLGSALAVASEALAHTDIVAPVGGTVVATNAKIRQRVEANDFAAPLFRLAEDAQESAIAFDVPRNDLKSLRIDAPVALTWNAEPGRTFSGVIARIDSRHSAAKEHADVIVFAQNSDGDPPAGAKVTGIVETTLRDNVLRAPLAALRFVPRLDAAPSRTDDEEPRLWVLRNGALTRVGVALGVDDGRYAEIVRGGLEEGDQIVDGENNAKAP
jgi:HlyD family secretion protein